LGYKEWFVTWHGGVPFKELGMDEEKYGLLKDLAEHSDYWKSALGFIDGVRGKNPSQLTQRQRNWLSQIIESLGEELTAMELKGVIHEG